MSVYIYEWYVVGRTRTAVWQMTDAEVGRVGWSNVNGAAEMNP